MRRTLYLSLMGISLTGWCMAQSDPFAGTWLNVAGYSSGELHRLVITSDSTGNNIHGYGSCSGGECDWGSVTLTTLAALTGAPNPTGSYGVAKFSTITLALHMEGPRLVVETYDASVPNAAFHVTEIMRMGPPTPAQLMPLDGAQFTNVPRTAVLTWQTNSEAVSYGIEVDQYDSCQVGAWCSDTGGGTLIIEGPPAPSIMGGIQASSYTYLSMGANPTRWRVWSVGSDGVRSPKSEWWNLTFLN